MDATTLMGKGINVKYIVIALICVLVFAFFYKEHHKVLKLEKINKQQQEAISNLESRVSDLESRASDLESRASDLESEISDHEYRFDNLEY